ncbi:MAG: hypothetical protein RL514_1100 [Verrucomicrobiota bacterium]|jgi:uncharacterized delta-60 repeat protein
MRAIFSQCRTLCFSFLLLGLSLAFIPNGWSQTGRPQNDAFNRGLLITNSLGTANQFSQFPNGGFGGNFPGLYNFNATKQAGEPAHAGDGGGASTWFFWTPQHTGPASFSLRPAGNAGFNGSLLAAYTGVAVNALTGVASNAAFSSVNTMYFPAVAGTTYAIAVDGPTNFFLLTTNTFAYAVDWSVTTNDNFASATILPGVIGIVTNDNTGASKELGEPLHAGDPGGASLWYQWTAPTDGPVTFAVADFNFTGTSFLLAVYTNASLVTLSTVTNTNGFFNPSVTFTAVKGVTYSIAVDGAETFLGSGVAQTAPFTLSYVGTISTDAGHFTFSTRTQTVAETEMFTDFTGGNFGGLGGEIRDIFGAVVTIIRTNAATGRMVVSYTTADSSALAGTDYGTNGLATPITGSVTFDDYQMSTNFVIPVIYNSFSSNSGTFQVLITSVQPDTNSVNGFIENPALTPTFDATPLIMTVANVGENIYIAGQGGGTNGVVSFTRSQYRRREFAQPGDTNLNVQVGILKVGGDPNGSVTATVRIQTRGAGTGPNLGENNTFALLAGSDYATPSNQVSGGGGRDPGPPDFSLTAVDNNVTVPGGGSLRNSVPLNITVFDDPVVELNEDIELILRNSSADTQPNPYFSTNGYGYTVGQLSRTILTIVQEDIYGQEQPAGALDNTWNLANHRLTSPPNNPTPGANNVVFAVAVQPDQKTLIVGDFTAVNTVPRNRVARLLPGIAFTNQATGIVSGIDYQAGQLDTTFAPGSGADNFINTVVVQTNGAILIGGGFSSYTGVSRNGIARLTSTGALDTTFDPGAGVDPGDTADKAIQSLALLADGRVVAAGNFTTFNSQSFNRVVRLTATGGVDPTFSGLGIGPNDRVYSVVAYTNSASPHFNKLLIAGAFTSVNGVTLNHLARLNVDGSVDASFNAFGAGVDGDIFSVALDVDERILIGGNFANVDIFGRRGVARLTSTGQVDSSFDPGNGTDDAVHTIVPGPVKAGSVTNKFANGFNATLDLALLHNFVVGDVVVITGVDPALDGRRTITGAGASSITFAAAASFGDTAVSPAGLVHTIGTIYIGGTFNSYHGTRRMGVARLLDSGLLDTSFMDTTYNHFAGLTQPLSTSPRSACFSIGLETNGNLMIGGDFTRVGGGYGREDNSTGFGTIDLVGAFNLRDYISTRLNVARLIGNSTPGPGNIEFTTAQYTVDEFTGSYFTTISRTNGSLAAAPFVFQTVDGTAKGAPNATNTGGTDFIHTNITTGFISAYNLFGNGNIESDLLSGLSGYNSNPTNANGAFVLGVATVRVTILQDSLVEGNESFGGILTLPGISSTNPPYTMLGGVPVVHGIALGRHLSTFAISDDDFAYGTFTFSATNYTVTENVGTATITVNRTNGATGTVTVRYNTAAGAGGAGRFTGVSGTLTFSPGQTNRAFTITVIDDTIVNSPLNGLVTLTLTNATGGASIATNGGRATLTIQDNELPAGTPAGSVNTAFGNSVGSNEKVLAAAYLTNTLASQNLNGRWLIGGDFTTVDGLPRNRIAMLNVDGSVNTSVFNRLGTGPDSTVSVIAVHATNAASTNFSGRIVIGGSFLRVDGTNRSRIARLNPDGSLDTAFNPGAGADNPVYAIAIQPDDKIIIAGDFATFNGTSRNRIVRLNSNGSIDNSFNPGQGANATVRAVVIDSTGTNIYIAGDFTTFDGITQNRVARLRSNGALDTTYVDPNNPNAGANARVRGLALEPDGKLVLAGDFTTVGGLASQVRVGRLLTNGLADVGFAATADNAVLTVAVDSRTNIVIGGDFTAINGRNRTRIARLLPTGQLDASINFGTGPNNYVAALALELGNNGVITIGGGFTQVDGFTRNNYAQLIGGENLGIGTVQFLATNFNVLENVGIALFTVRRVGGLTNGVSVDYATVDGTALTGTHYLTSQGTLFFQQGEAVQTFTLPIIDGTGTNVDRVFTNVILNPTNYDVVLGTNLDFTILGAITNATVTIQDNDSELGFAFANFNVNENVVGGSAIVTVVRLGGAVGSLTVSYLATNGVALAGMATAGLDFTAVSGQLNFTNGQTSAAFLVPISNDLLVEGTETVQLTLFGPSPIAVAGLGRSTATLNIVDDDFSPGVLVFSLGNYTVQEDGTNATITVLRTNGGTGLVTVQYFTADGSARGFNGLGSPLGFDYTNANGTLTFGDGETIKAFTIGVIDNAVADTNANRTVNLSLGNPTGGVQLGSQSTAVLTIQDNELSSFGAFTFSQAAYTVVETNTVASITVNRSGGSLSTVTVDFTTSGGTASAGTNYLPLVQTLTFSSGETTTNVFVPVIYDPGINGDKTVNLILYNPTGGAALGSPSNAVLTLADNEFSPGVLSFVTNLFSVSENVTNAVITVIRTNGFTGLVTVDYGVSNLTALAGADFANVFGTLTFNTGVATQSFVVPVFDNLTQEGNRLFEVRLFNQVGGASLGLTNGTVRIVDNEAAAGSLDTGFVTGSGADGPVFALGVTTNGQVFVGGEFSLFSGVNRSNVARLNAGGALDATFVPDAISRFGTNASVHALGVYTNGTNAGKIIIGGAFDTVGGMARSNLARLNPSGSVDLSFDPGLGADNTVQAVQIQSDGKVLIGGLFTLVNGTSRSFIARLNVDGSLDSTFTPGSGADGPVRGLATDPSGRVFIVGDFISVDGVARNRVARLNSDGTVDKTFDPGTGANAGASAVAVNSGSKPVIGGVFTNVTGLSRNRIVRFNVDGVLDGSFAPGAGADEFISAVAIQPDGKVVVGGGFLNVDGLPRNRITRLNSDGTVDVSFNTGTGANDVISAVRVQNDGAILIAGAFTAVNGQAHGRVARLVGGANLGSGSFDFSGATFAVGESLTNALITVVRSGGTSNSVTPVTVNFGTANGTATDGFDYVGTNGTLTFGSGVTHQTFTVPVVGNSIVDGSRTVGLAIFSPQGGATLGGLASAVLTLLDDDSVLGYSPQAYSVNENGGFATITVARAGGTLGTVTVDYFTVDGTAVAGTNGNYLATNGTLTFTNGQTTATFAVSVNDNVTVDGNKTVNLVLTNAAGSGGGTAVIGGGAGVLTIVDNEFAPGSFIFSPASYSVAESGTNITVTLVRTNGTAGVVSVAYTTLDVTATNGLDYTAMAGVFTFGDGELSKTLTIPLLPDALFESDEVFTVALSNPTGGAALGAASTATVTITDMVLGFTTNHFVVNESAINGLVTVFRANPNNTNNTAAVTFSTVLGGTAVIGVDYLPITTNLTFAAGELSKTVAVPLFDDLVGVGSRTVLLQLTNVTGGASLAIVSAVMTIEDNDPILVNYTWSSGNAITLNDAAVASPYPSVITVVGVPGVLNKLTVTLSNLTHAAPADLDFLLVGPQGQSVVLMSDAGSGNAVSGVTLTFDESLGATLPTTGLINSGTYRTADYGGADLFPAPAPAGPYGTNLGNFSGSNPNGAWTLYVVDDSAGSVGVLTNGWSLQFTMLVPTITNDLQVALADSADPVEAGSNYTYTAVVFNRSTRSANNVTLYDILSPGLNVTGVIPSQGTFVSTNGALVCSLGVIQPNASATVRVNVTANTVGVVSNVVSVIAAEFDNDLGNNTAVQSTTVVAPGAVVVTSGLTISPTNNASALVNALVASNSGLTITSFSLLGHSRPAGQVSTAIFNATGQGNIYNLSGSGIILSSGDVNSYLPGPNTSVGTTFSYGTAATAAQEALLGPITGSATNGITHNDVTQFDVVFDVGPGVNRVAFEVVYGSEEYPEFVGSPFKDPFGLYLNGVNIAFTPDGRRINIDNPGMTNLAGTELDGILVIGGSSILTFSAPVMPGSANNRLTFIVGDASDFVLDTTVFITGLRAVAAPPADGAIEVTVAPNPVLVGDNLTYTVALNNNSTSNSVQSAVVTNVLPAGVTLVGAAASQGSVVVTGGVLTATLGNIGPNQSAFVTLTVGTASTGLLNSTFGLNYLNVGVPTSKTASVSTDVLPRLTTFLGSSVMLADSGPAFTYPATINVAGLTGVVDQVTVTLSNLSHTFPADLDILLVGPQGQSVLLMSDAGGNVPMTAATLTFTDGVTNYLPATNLIVTGSYRVTDYAVGPADTFAAPAPAGPYGAALSAFRNTDPTGVWKLFVMDDQGNDVGALGGWSLTFTSTIATLPPPVPPSLLVQFSAGVFTFSWPTNATGFFLESSPLTGTPPAWTTVSTPPLAVGTNFNVSVNAVNGPLFFRLRHP